MTRLDDIEDAARFRFECASTDGGKQLYGDILALVAVARAAKNVFAAWRIFGDEVTQEMIELSEALELLESTAPRQGNTRHE